MFVDAIIKMTLSNLHGWRQQCRIGLDISEKGDVDRERRGRGCLIWISQLIYIYVCEYETGMGCGCNSVLRIGGRRVVT